MKRFLPLALGITALAVVVPSTLAQTTVLNWDADGAAGLGGTGAWDTTSTLWNTAGSGAANSIWTTGTGASGFAANFGGAAGTVTVQAGGITTGVLAAGNQSALNFDAGGYTITGGKITIDNTGGGNDRSFLRFASGNTTAINNAIDITPSALGSGTFNRLVQARVNNSTITLGGAINIIGTTAGTHTLDFITGGGATGVRLNLDGAIGDAAGAAVTRVRIASNAPNDMRDLTVRLSAANTFTGGISGKGKMLVANNSALGTGGMTIGGDGGAGSGALLTDAAVTIGNTVGSGNSGVTAITIGGNSAHVSSFTGNVDLATNTAGLTNSKIGLQAVSGGEVTFSGLINDGASTIGMDKFGAGTVVLSRAAGNTVDGAVNIVNGTLLANNTSGSATGTGALTVGSAAGSLSGGATTNGSTLATVNSTAGMVIGQTITGTNIAGGTYVEQIKNGTTIILSHNATGTASGLTFSLAASNGILGGSGIISGSTTVLSGSSIAPGASAGTIGTLTFDGATSGTAMGTFSTGATFSFDLNATSVTSDTIALTNGAAGDFVFNNNVINFSVTGSLISGQSYTLFDGTANDQFSGLTVDGSNRITGGLNFTGLSEDFAPNSYLSLVGGDIVFTAVPEPATWALLAGALTAMLAIRRRHRA